MDQLSSTEQPKSFFQSLWQVIAKIWVVVTSVIGSTILVGVVIVLLLVRSFSPDQPTYYGQKTIKTGSADKIAVIRLNGIIADKDSGEGDFSFDPSGLSSTDAGALLDEAKNDASVKAVILRINSPGGAVVASDEVYRHVLDLKSSKPVVAALADTAASGGYYIASGATKIMANPATITGSIGVIMELPKLSELYKKIGVEMRTLKTGEFKDIGSENRDLTEAENDLLKSIMTDSYNQFIAAIVKGRSLPEDKVRTLADGRIFSGIQAKQNGLVDELGNDSDAIKLAAGLANVSDPTVIEFTKESFLGSLLSSRLKSLDLFSLLGSAKPKSSLSVMYLMNLN